jgi:hypothetical protein
MRRWSFIAGAVLVLLGVLAILNAIIGITLHLFWPIILIAVGAWIIFGMSRGRSSGGPREQASVPLDGARDAAVTIHHGAGHLSVGSGAGGDQLLAGTFGGGLDAARYRDGSRLVVDMKIKERDVGRYFFGPWRNHGGLWGVLDWDFGLNPAIPLSLRVESGASKTRLALEDLQVRELLLKTGASSTTVDLPSRAGHTMVTVESGAAAVKLRVPPGVAASINVRSTIAGVHVDASRFKPYAGGYRSADFDSAANKVEIFVETAVGSLEIT